MTKKHVYNFSEGNAGMKMLLGGKGANLAEMTMIGIPVPPGFTVTTEACEEYYNNKKSISKDTEQQISSSLKRLEKEMGCGFGDQNNPLLVSVRSGAAVSMPGMMDTVLNLGLNPQVVEGLIKKTGNKRFVIDSYRRFIQMFGDVVLGIEHRKFESILEGRKQTKGVLYDTELDHDDLTEIADRYRALVEKETGQRFPDDPWTQLIMAVAAVFESWNNDRAILYRKLHDIKGLNGTAVNVQAMVFGNMGESSGTGVCFTRDPATGENRFYGEYLMNAQGEDVVAGIRTPQRLETLEDKNKEAYNKLCSIRHLLEKHYKDMQDIEFTIQEGKLYLLQTRSGKRTAAAAVRIAVEMVKEKLIDKKTALMRVEPASLDQLLHDQIDPVAKKEHEAAATGLPASPGAAVGHIVFDAHKAHELNEQGKDVILVRTETSPEDLIGINAAQGILTSRGGMTSHAAVVARGMGKCCVAGCNSITIHEEKGYLEVKGTRLMEGEYLTLDGATGEVFIGRIPTVEPSLSAEFSTLMSWADEVRRLKIRTNADTPHDAETALRFGAEGIGLCRTEHMFFEGERIRAMREMIVAETVEERKEALAKLLPFQKHDFSGLFKVMKGKPVTIRLLDPPLHEFLPKEDEEIRGLAKELGIAEEKLRERIEALHEQNPMLGHRGCRLGITYPEIIEMQTRAIIEAALEQDDKNLVPEIMVPLVGDVEELKNQKGIIRFIANELISKKGSDMRYMIGTMIEVPRAALTAEEIAEQAEFFSFGTNDLTQMTFGFSRDDTGTFLPEYLKLGVLEKDPFQALDQKGVGSLVRIAVDAGRKARPKLKIGICGEHGGEPSSVMFCHDAGLDYVSCSPYRVPIAKLASAQAAIREKC
ncbi:pyruvate, phosphate dikinase [Candidatus Woesearchaeota archaeon]|nr:pyruvate, phosphate dikinase [Candidatus Woesearchaeota archaeon]